MIRDLLGIRSIAAMGRIEGLRREVAARSDPGAPQGRGRRPAVVTLARHRLEAQPGRNSGVELFRERFADRSAPTHRGPAVLRATPRLGFTADRGGRRRPVVEYAAGRDGKLTPIESPTIDAEGPFGEAVLDELCWTSLGRGRLPPVAPGPGARHDRIAPRPPAAGVRQRDRGRGPDPAARRGDPARAPGRLRDVRRRAGRDLPDGGIAGPPRRRPRPRPGDTPGWPVGPAVVAVWVPGTGPAGRAGPPLRRAWSGPVRGPDGELPRRAALRAGPRSGSGTKRRG